MKKIKLILASALLPIALLAQKGHGHGNHGGGHGNKHGNKHDRIVIYSQPNVIVVNEKKAKPYKIKYRHGNPK